MMSDRRFLIGFVIWYLASVGITALAVLSTRANLDLVLFAICITISAASLFWWFGKAGAWNPMLIEIEDD